MKKMTMKSLLLTVLAMVAVCMTSVSLTACGSDGRRRRQHRRMARDVQPESEI